MAFDPKNNVFTVDVSELSITAPVSYASGESSGETASPEKYTVAGLAAVATDSGIPQIQVLVHPQPNPGENEIKVPTLPMIVAWHSHLQGLAATKKATAALTLSLVSSGKDPETQKLEVKRWILTSAAMVNVSADGTFDTQLTLEHPVVASNQAVLAMLNSYYSAGAGEPVEAANVMEAMLSSIDRYLKQRAPTDTAEASDIGGEGLTAEDIRAIDAAVHAKAVEALEVLKANLVWSGTKGGGGHYFPFDGYDNDAVDLCKRRLSPGPYLDSMETVYGTFMAMAGQLMLTVNGAFTDDPLTASPMEPWWASDIMVAEHAVNSIGLPVVPNIKISGVVSMGAMTNGDMYLEETDNVKNSRGGRSANMDIVVQGAYVDKMDKINGRIKVIGMPEYLAIMSVGTPAGDSQADEYTMNDQQAENSGGSNPQANAAAELFGESFGPMMNAYCHDEFWRTYGADTVMSLTTRLFLTVKSGDTDIVLRPGLILDLVSDDGDVLYTCYITGVYHEISCLDGRARTTISGAYVRGEKGIPGIYEREKPVSSAVYGDGPMDEEGAEAAEETPEETPEGSGGEAPEGSGGEAPEEAPPPDNENTEQSEGEGMAEDPETAYNEFNLSY